MKNKPTSVLYFIKQLRWSPPHMQMCITGRLIISTWLGTRWFAQDHTISLILIQWILQMLPQKYILADKGDILHQHNKPVYTAVVIPSDLHPCSSIISLSSKSIVALKQRGWGFRFLAKQWVYMLFQNIDMDYFSMILNSPVNFSRCFVYIFRWVGCIYQFKTGLSHLRFL